MGETFTTSGAGYPVQFDTDYGDGTRSRGLAVTGILYFIKNLLALPLGFLGFFLGLAAAFVAYVGYFVVLFTGRMPEGMHRFISGAIGWTARLYAWLFSLTDTYPPFELHPAAYEAQFTAEPGDLERSRGWAAAGIFFLKFLLALPHLLIIGVLQWVGALAAWVGYWIIAFTGELPESLHRFLDGVIRWSVRAWAWIAGLTDDYPPFALED